MTTSTDLLPSEEFELDQRRAKAYAESGYWPDAKSIAQALVKIEAGRALGIAPIVAMSEIHVIEGKPTLGAGALSPLVKAHPRYDYRILELTDDICRIRFYENGEVLGESKFDAADAEKAELPKRNPSYRRYPRNMLFARAISNGVAWFCPDVTNGRLYVPEDFEELPSGLGSQPTPADGNAAPSEPAAVMGDTAGQTAQEQETREALGREVGDS